MIWHLGERIITSGRMKRRQEIMDRCGMNVRILTSNKPVQLMEIYRQYKSI
ncbi:pilin protein [Escherichia coli]|nr:pilin protein [Escherichia coli]